MVRAIWVQGESVSSRRKQAGRSDCPRAAHVPKRLISPIFLWEPLWERVPPEILRATTAGRRLHSARLLVEGTSGYETPLRAGCGKPTAS
jgi:hypothetical protein